MKVITLAKEKFLKKIYNKIKFLFFISPIFLFLTFNGNYSRADTLSEINVYLKSLNEFSCNFIQASPSGDISEGHMVYSENKIKINYVIPTKITFVAKKNKAMYFNEDLMEVEYFNPNKTAYKFFKSLFNLENLKTDSYKVTKEENVVKLELSVDSVEEVFEFIVIFENNPLLLKKIQWTDVEGLSTFSIYDLRTSIEINKKTFSMLNPIINN